MLKLPMEAEALGSPPQRMADPPRLLAGTLQNSAEILRLRCRIGT